MTSKTHALFCSIFYIFAINNKKWTYYIQRYENKWHEKLKITNQLICYLIKQIRFFRNRLFVVVNDFLFSNLQSIKIDRLIKISKNSNSKNLKQHTFAKSILFCCFCFCFVLKYRSFHYINLQIFSRSKFSTKFSTRFSFSSHIFIFFLFAHFLFSNLFFHVYRICFEIFCFNFDQIDIWITINEFFRNVDRLKKKIYSFRNEIWKKEINNVTNMFENLNCDFILSTKIHMKINAIWNLTFTIYFWHSIFCTYLFFQSNIFVMLFVF